MKKNSSLVLLCLIFSYFVNAQNTQTQSKSKVEASTAQFGIKAGVNVADIKIKNDAADYEARTGFHIGALAHIHISDHFAVQPEVMYSTQGAESGDIKLKYNYINVPLLLQLMTNNGFRLQTGPQAGFLVSAKVKNGDLETNNKKMLNTFAMDWTFGASYLSKSGLGLDVRYNLGLSNIIDDDVAFPESKNRVWQIGAFYQFPQ